MSFLFFSDDSTCNFLKTHSCSSRVAISRYDRRFLSPGAVSAGAAPIRTHRSGSFRAPPGRSADAGSAICVRAAIACHSPQISHPATEVKRHLWLRVQEAFHGASAALIRSDQSPSRRGGSVDLLPAGHRSGRVPMRPPQAYDTVPVIKRTIRSATAVNPIRARANAAPHRSSSFVSGMSLINSGILADD